MFFFERVKAKVHTLPDLDLGKDKDGRPLLLSCHMLCRALGKVLGLKVFDGVYGVGCAHSWLMTPDKEFVIDPYPVAAIGGPIMVHAASPFFPGSTLYKQQRHVKSINFTSPAFLRAVRLLVREMRRTDA